MVRQSMQPAQSPSMHRQIWAMAAPIVLTNVSVPFLGAVDTAVVEGRAYREILGQAADKKADLIVMGVHGRGALDLLLFGSTTHHVIRASACPVLIVRQG